MSQLYASKRPCNQCGGLISWDKGLREYLGTKLPLNLDRTIHDKASCNAVKEEHPGLPTETVADIPSATTATPYAAKQDARSKAIEDAHNENMEASERLRQSIDHLAEVIEKLATIKQSGGVL